MRPKTHAPGDPCRKGQKRAKRKSLTFERGGSKIFLKEVSDVERRNWLTKAEMTLVFGIPGNTIRNWLREGKIKPAKGEIWVKVYSLAFGLDEIKQVMRRRKTRPDFSRLSADKRDDINWRMILEEIGKAGSDI